MEKTLHGEIATLGHPQAALFAFGVALLAFNIHSTIKAALRAVHGEEICQRVSGSDVAEEIAATHRGMMVAIPEEEWTKFQDLSPESLGSLLRHCAGLIRLSEYRKQPRGPKKPRPNRASGAEVKHIATSRILRGQKQ